MYSIFIVEDDPVIAETLQAHLNTWGYTAHVAKDFQNVTEQFIHLKPHLVLMDLTLPAFNGFHWCTEIRKLSKTPIVFLSSAADNMNIVMAVTMGADDFIAKPFDLNVLTAKIGALLRRTYAFQGETQLLEHGGIILNLGDASVQYQDQKVELTKNEFRILQALMESPGKTISRDVMMTRLWESDSFIDDNTLTVNVTRLRKKLEDAGITDYIQTKKGLGYMVN